MSTNISFSGSIPKMYDEILGPVYFEPYAIDIAARVEKRNPAAVLETACGTGRVTVHLRKNISEKAVLISTDINPDMMLLAKEKFSSDANIEWQQADATQLPFGENKFDVVITAFGVMFYPDKLLGFKEALRVLKNGGTFIFNVWDKIEDNGMSKTGREIVTAFFTDDPPAFYNIPYSFNDVNAITSLLKEAGFSKVEVEVLKKDCIAESADVMSGGLVEGNPIVNAIRERDANAIPVLRKKVFETLVERFGDHPCKTTMQAIVFTAVK